MPQYVRLGENLDDRKCSKCKRMREPEDYVHRNLVFRTCNHCRFKAYQRMHPLNTISDFNREANRIVNIDTDSEYSVQDRVAIFESELLTLSSSAAASSESYFGPEPEPEPEPDM